MRFDGLPALTRRMGALVLSSVVGLGATGAVLAAKATVVAVKHWGVLSEYCVKCHNTEDWAGGIAFDTLDAQGIPEDAQTWEAAVRKLRTGMMPPPGKPRPSRSVLDAFAMQLEYR